MKKVLFLLFFINILSLTAQQNKPFELYKDIEAEALASVKNGDYEETLEILRRVNKNDSMYINSLVSRSYYLLELERYEEALEIIETALATSEGKITNAFYTNKAFALSNLGKKDEALKAYDKGIEKFPADGDMILNKAILLEEMEKLDEALKLYKKAVFLNPLEKKTHLRLGQICYRQHKLSQALMAFNIALILDPDGPNAFQLLKALNELVVLKNENLPNSEIRVSKDERLFAELDLILENKLALNNRYEIDTDIPIPLIKQNHMLLSQLKNIERDKGFWTDVYMSIYNWIAENDKFENFTYTISYSIENPSYKKIVSRKTDDVKEFLASFIEEWVNILQDKSHLYLSDENLSVSYAGKQVDGIGKMSGDLPVGDWNYYSETGTKLAIGSYNEKGQRHGSWKWYHPNGMVRETGTYVDGEVSGENLHYFEDGKPYIVANFQNGELNGEYLVFNEYGALVQKKHFTDGELDGKFKSYFRIGEQFPEIEGNYIMGYPEGKAYEYFENGDIYTEMNFVKGNKQGAEKTFYRNGNQYIDLNYKEGKLHGNYKEYFLNGAVSQEGYYEEGKLQGEWKTYYQNGNLASLTIYDDGLAIDLYQEFDIDGKLYLEYDYRKGEIIAYRFFDKKGNKIADEKKKGGEFFYKALTPYGEVNSEGRYDISGGKTGEWKFYTKNGIIKEKGSYEMDRPQGVVTTYYISGITNSEVNYKDGVMEGSARFFYPNGQIKSQGLFVNDKKQGVWEDHYIDGTIKGVNFYHNGELHGEQVLYGPQGKKYMTDYYNFGKLDYSIAYLQDGHAFDTINYKQNKDLYVVKTHYPSGKLKESITYLYGYKHGEYKSFDVEGNLVIKGNYFNNLQHGPWKWFRENGDLRLERNYEHGSLNGTNYGYFENGQLDTEYNYTYDLDSGIWHSYHENGELATKTPYVSGEEHGAKEFYDDQGNLQQVRYYQNGRIIGYSYPDSDGIIKPMIPIENESGSIKTYYSNGKLARETALIGGEFHDDYRTFYNNGQLMEITPYEHGLRNGMNVEYYKDGNKKMETEFLYDNLHGIRKKYYPNGKLKNETVFKNDVEIGPSIYYDSAGKVEKKEEFLNGEVIRIEKVGKS